VILAAALLLVTATAAQARGGPDVRGTYTYVYSGGTSTITIAAWDDGRGTFTFARDNGVIMEGDLTCVLIKGADAQVWGLVTYAENTPFTSWGARVRDGGLPDGGGDMAISFADLGEPPANCRIPPAWGQTANLMVPITSGDIRVD
jgi:hypothetical protein